LNIIPNTYQNTPEKEGYDMRNIRMQGYCPICNRFYKTKCKHGVPARYFFVDFSYKGQRFIRGTNLDGETLRELNDAVELQRQIKRDIRNGGFNLAKYTAKLKPDFQFHVKVEEWYQEKIRLQAQGYRRPGYTVKLRQYITHYFDYFNSQDIRSIYNIKDFQLQLPAKLSQHYKKNIVDALIGFFRWCRDEGHIDKVPRYERVKVNEHIPKTLSLDDRLAILSKIPDEHKPIFTFLFYQGARPSEVRALKWDCIEGDIVTIKRTFSNGKLIETTKESNIRKNYIFPEVMDVLPKSGFPLDFVFQHGKTVRRKYSETFLNDLFRRAYDGDSTLYESSKHSFGTEWRNKGMSLDNLRAWFGHKSVKTTEIYSKCDPVNAFKEKVGRIK
jgi:integrase